MIDIQRRHTYTSEFITDSQPEVFCVIMTHDINHPSEHVADFEKVFGFVFLFFIFYAIK